MNTIFVVTEVFKKNNELTEEEKRKLRKIKITEIFENMIIKCENLEVKRS